MSRLNIKLLGGFAITCDDRPVSSLTSLRSQALLAYLLLHHDAPQPRQRLAFDLWADSSDTQARTNLRKELSYLRRDLPQADTHLIIASKTLQWSPLSTFSLDVLTFEQAIKTATDPACPNPQSHLEQAIELYRGELLPSCEDEWIGSERDRLQQLYIHALEQLIECLQEQKNYRLALNYAQQLLRLDTLNEATYSTLMRLYHLNGDRANALQIYHRCMTALREELGIDPSPTTRKLYETLLLEDAAPSPSPAILPTHPPIPATNPLIGRQPEWQQLQQWFNQPADHRQTHTRSSVFLLLGEPGIGKTRLLEELRTKVPVALWGRAFAAEMVRPYGIWIDALRSLPLPTDLSITPELGWLLPELGEPSKVVPDRSHLFDAVVQLLATWAKQKPLLVILDDIHWIDEASSALLHYASRLQLAAEQCLKLFAYAEAGILAQRGIQSCQSLDPATSIHLQLALLRILALSGVSGDRATQAERDLHELIDAASRLGLKDDEAVGLEALGCLYFNQSDYQNVHRSCLHTADVSRLASPAAAARLLAFSGTCLAETGQDMQRAEALLQEAKSLADRMGIEYCDIYTGLGGVALFKGDQDLGRSCLQQALQLAYKEQDHWRECTCLINLTMIALDSGNPQMAMNYCDEIARIANQIEGNDGESAIATALKALIHYHLQQPTAEQDLAIALTRLQELDIKRIIACIQISAATVDQLQQQWQMALERSESALANAKIMNQISEIVLSGALVIQNALALEQHEQAIATFTSLKDYLDSPNLSLQARQAIEQATERISPFLPSAVA